MASTTRGVVVEEREGGNTKSLQLIVIQRYRGCTEETNVSLPNSNNINYNNRLLAVMPLMTKSCLQKLFKLSKDLI